MPEATGGRRPLRHYCTYFDSGYLARGLTLYRSLERHAGEFVLWVLCFDDVAYEALRALELAHLRPVSLAEFEEGDAELVAAKPTRSRVEYFFTCTPSWPLYVFRHEPSIELLTYLDADLYLFSSLEPVFDELGDDSLLITRHDFPARLKEEERHGVFNVGLMVFRNDAVGREALEWWRERCLEWCYDRVDEGRYADQKYLDRWPELFSQVTVLASPAGALAPWNWMNHTIVSHGGRITVGGDELITYHFQSVSLHWGRVYTLTVSLMYQRMPSAVRRKIYRPYVRELAGSERLVRRGVPVGRAGQPTRDRRPLRVRGLVKAWLAGDAGLRIR